MKRHLFSFCLLASAVAGAALPDVGGAGGLLRTEITTRLGVFMVFLLQGLLLDRQALLEGLINVRLHVVVLACNFLLAPLLGLLLWQLCSGILGEPVAVGLALLACLPTTVSSAVTMVSLAGGNVPGAVFSTTLSNIFGVFIAPLAVLLLLGNGGGGAGIEAASAGQASGGNMLAVYPQLLGKLAVIILVPLAVGQVLQGTVKFWLPGLTLVAKPLLSSFICFMVFASFANSTQAGVWGEDSLLALVLLVAVDGLFLAALAGLCHLLCGLCLPDRKTRLAGFFCGYQKSLATGVPMVTAALAGSDHASQSGLLLLPLLVYHLLQLLTGAWLVQCLEYKA